MTAFAKIRAGRVNTLPFNQFIGEAGHLFYDVTNGEIRLSNGVTPGGLPITITASTISTASILPDADNDPAYGLGSETYRWHHAHIGDGGIYFDAINSPQTVPYIPGSVTADIIPSINNQFDLGNNSYRWANVYIGPKSIHMQDQTRLNDVEIAVNNGTLYLNGVQNLAVGNLVILDTTLKTITASTSMSLGDRGDTGNLFINRYATLTSNVWPSGTAAFTINGSDTATLPDLSFLNTALRIVSKAGTPGRTVTESYGTGAYGVYTARTGRGTVAAPSATQSGDIIARFSGQGYGTTKFGSLADARIDIQAAETFTDAAHGTDIVFWTTAPGANVATTTSKITSNGFYGNTVTFSTDGTVQQTAGIPMTYRGNLSANKVATLGVDGKLDVSQIPSSLSGSVVFRGSWNASTNTPTLGPGLPSGVQAGWEYIVGDAGSQTIEDGSTLRSYNIGDLVIYDGAHWNRIQSVSSFTSLTAASASHLLVNGNVNTAETGVLSISTDATPNNTASKLVSRDTNGSFSANIISASLSGTATAALTAATVTTAAQPNITSVGTLSSLSVTGNIGSANVNANTYGTHNGNVINGNSSVNISANSNVTITATSNATLTITGTGANIAGTANISGNANVGNVGTGTIIATTANLTTINGALHQNGNSNVTITANSNITLTATSNATAVITSTGANVAGYVTATGMVTAKNYSGGIRDVGTLGAAGTVTIDFATDHMILVNLTTTATIAFANITAGKTVTVVIKNATGSNRVITAGVNSSNTSGGDATPTVTNGHSGVFVYRTFGTATTDIYCEVN